MKSVLESSMKIAEKTDCVEPREKCDKKAACIALLLCFLL